MAPSVINLSNLTPAALAGFFNGAWQGDTNNPRNVSVSVPIFGGSVTKSANYTVQAADCGQLLVGNTGGITFTLPAAVPSVPDVNGVNRWKVSFQNISTGTLTVAVTSPRTLDGVSTSLVLTGGQGIDLWTDGTNYFTMRGLSSGSGGGLNGVNKQTSSYTLLSGDNGKLITYGGTGAATFTLPSAAPSSTWAVFIGNTSANNLTINPNGLQLDGVTSSFVLQPNNGIIIFTDGTNYFTERGVSDKPVFLSSMVPGLPGAGQEVLIYTAPWLMTFPGNFSQPTSYGSCDVNPTATATYVVYKNGSTVGSIVVSTAGVFTFATTSGASITLNPGDRLTVVAPGTQDVTLANVGFTLVGARSSVAGTVTSPVGVNWRGTYSGSTAYNSYDAVSYSGSSYICITPNTGQLPTNPSYWSLMAQAGMNGTLLPSDQQNQTYDYVVGGGTANAATASPSTAYGTLQDGMQISVKWPATNTSSTVTLNVSSHGAVAVQVPGTTGLTAPTVGALQANCTYVFTYNSVTPCWQLTGGGGSGAGGVTQIAQVVANGSSTTVTFSSIPSIYTNLRIVGAGRTTSTGTGTDNIALTFNSDTGANYTNQYILANGTGLSAVNETGKNACRGGELPKTGCVATYPGQFVIEIANYAGTTFAKTFQLDYNVFNNTTTSSLFNIRVYCSWSGVAAINRIDLTISGNWVAGSTVTLYGEA